VLPCSLPDRAAVPFNYVVPSKHQFHFRLSRLLLQNPVLAQLVAQFQGEHDGPLPSDNRFSAPTIGDSIRDRRAGAGAAHLMEFAPAGSENLGQSCTCCCEFQVLDAESEAHNETAMRATMPTSIASAKPFFRRLRLGAAIPKSPSEPANRRFSGSSLPSPGPPVFRVACFFVRAVPFAL